MDEWDREEVKALRIQVDDAEREASALRQSMDDIVEERRGLLEALRGMMRALSARTRQHEKLLKKTGDDARTLRVYRSAIADLNKAEESLPEIINTGDIVGDVTDIE